MSSQSNNNKPSKSRFARFKPVAQPKPDAKGFKPPVAKPKEDSQRRKDRRRKGKPSYERIIKIEPIHVVDDASIPVNKTEPTKEESNALLPIEQEDGIKDMKIDLDIDFLLPDTMKPEKVEPFVEEKFMEEWNTYKGRENDLEPLSMPFIPPKYIRVNNIPTLETLSLFQLPYILPENLAELKVDKMEVDVNIKRESEAGETDAKALAESSTNKLNNGFKLCKIPSGHLGKLKKYRSGKLKLVIGDVKYDVAPGVGASFKETAIHIDSTSTKELTLFGNISARLICTPSFMAAKMSC